jgi:putative oxidoreductase
MNSQFTLLIRVVLGIMLVVFGSNMFLHFIPIPTLGATSYIFPVVGVFEVIIGVMLLLKRWVAFALVLLAPISINIVLFHAFLYIPGIEIALLVAIFNAILIYKHWKQYIPLFA